MNNYFATAGNQLAKEFPAQITPEHYILSVAPSIQELIIDEKLLLNQLKTINPDKVRGPDDIKPNDFSIAGEALVDGLRIVLSKSKETRQVPRMWKRGKLKVAYKKGNSTKRSNYRPLTMLCLPSKILEHVAKQGDKHIEQHNLSNERQWGYKKGRSTELLLLNLTEQWKIALDIGKTIEVLFIDFKKAFDSVDHTIVLNKVQGKGLAGELYEWLTDYLVNRQQYTDLNGVYSKTQTVEYGVPQGFLLGSRLFKIYVDDLPDNVTECWLYMFAHDTTAYVIADNINVTIDKSNGK